MGIFSTPFRRVIPGTLAPLLMGFAPAVYGGGPLKVVAGNTILADMVREVGGAQVEVVCPVPPGVDLHGWDPRPSDVRDIASAGVVVLNGLGLEPGLEKLVGASGFKGALVHVTDGVEVLVDGHDVAGGHADGDACHAGCGHGRLSGGVDPHAWHDAGNAIIYAGNIVRGLCAARPELAGEFHANGAAYQERLRALDAWVREQLATIPVEGRRIVTAHDALGYYGRAYGVEILPLAGLSLLQEPDARHVARLVRTIREQRVRGIFAETVSSPKALALVAAEAGVPLGGELLTDSLAPAGEAGSTYIELIETNTRRIVSILAPSAPETRAP